MFAGALRVCSFVAFCWCSPVDCALSSLTCTVRTSLMKAILSTTCARRCPRGISRRTRSPSLSTGSQTLYVTPPRCCSAVLQVH